MAQKFNACPNCGRGAVTALFGKSSRTIYGCSRCRTLHCQECSGSRCPACGADGRSKVGHVPSTR